jgi:hypothetical protein
LHTTTDREKLPFMMPRKLIRVCGRTQALAILSDIYLVSSGRKLTTVLWTSKHQSLINRLQLRSQFMLDPATAAQPTSSDRHTKQCSAGINACRSRSVPLGVVSYHHLIASNLRSRRFWRKRMIVSQTQQSWVNWLSVPETFPLIKSLDSDAGQK